VCKHISLAFSLTSGQTWLAQLVVSADSVNLCVFCVYSSEFFTVYNTLQALTAALDSLSHSIISLHILHTLHNCFVCIMQDIIWHDLTGLQTRAPLSARVSLGPEDPPSPGEYGICRAVLSKDLTGSGEFLLWGPVKPPDMEKWRMTFSKNDYLLLS
jgi:hypothetical protein